jgi:formyl-CoA transferase
MNDHSDSGPLAGVRVLEFSQIVAAPVCGMNLADLGADVIKVEPPGGEQTRRGASVAPNESKNFQALNHGKRSLVVDLQDDRGRELIHRIVPQIDVVLINYRLGVAERLGIDYETLRGLRPDLIYWQNTGFGAQGPEAYRAGSDIVAQAFSGLMALDAKTNDDGAPDLVSSPVADIASGIGAAMGIVAALYHRGRTGRGQLIGTSLLRTALFLMGGSVMREPVHDAVLRDPLQAKVEAVREQGGSWEEILQTRSELRSLYGAFLLYYGGYRAKGGAVVLGALTSANRDAMREVLGIAGQEHSDGPDFDIMDPQNRAQADQWKRKIRAKFLTRTVDEWVADFDAAGAPVSPVYLPEEMADNPQVLADGMIEHLEHSVTGKQRVVGPIVTMSETPTAVPRAAPALGEHVSEVLLEFGLSQSEIGELTAAEVVVPAAS